MYICWIYVEFFSPNHNVMVIFQYPITHPNKENRSLLITLPYDNPKQPNQLVNHKPTIKEP